METANGIILGGIITIVTAFFIEWMKKPKIILSIKAPVDMVYPGSIHNVRFLGITVTNKNIICPFRFIQRNTANCSGNIQILDKNGKGLFSKSMTLRWSGSPEPGMAQLQFKNNLVPIIDIYRIMENSKVDIDPGISETFDVVAKYDNDTDCYGWNNECYLGNWRIPSRKIPQGQYRVIVKLNISGARLTHEYTLTNGQTRRDTLLS